MAKWGDILNEMRPDAVTYSPDFIEARAVKQGVKVTMGIDSANVFDLNRFMPVLFVIERAEFQAACKRVDEARDRAA